MVNTKQNEGNKLKIMQNRLPAKLSLVTADGAGAAQPGSAAQASEHSVQPRLAEQDRRAAEAISSQTSFLATQKKTTFWKRNLSDAEDIAAAVLSICMPYLLTLF